jgi:hypothetical protein
VEFYSVLFGVQCRIHQFLSTYLVNDVLVGMYVSCRMLM